MPKQYGGGDLPADKTVVLYDEIAKLGLALPPYYDAGGRMAAPTILVHGSEEHKNRFLPPICRGEVRTWQLLTEPGAGSDLAGIKMTVIRDGDHYVVNGTKVYVGSSHGADYSWTIVVTDPKGPRHKNLSWLMIPMNLPGITVTPLDLPTGGEGGSGSGVKILSSSLTCACRPRISSAVKTTAGKWPPRTSRPSTAVRAGSRTGA